MADSDNESGGHNNSNAAGDFSSHREQDRFLPIANVSRIMKKALPANAKISKDAKETVQECVSEFISFITGEASDKCQREKRKTINGDDLLWAMTTLGFEEYVDPLKVYLQKFREVEGEKGNTVSSQSQIKEGSAGSSIADGGSGSGGGGSGGGGSGVNIGNNVGGFSGMYGGGGGMMMMGQQMYGSYHHQMGMGGNNNAESGMYGGGGGSSSSGKIGRQGRG
ncbi:nuclear transcription factor Y subunit B-3-like [Typha latifolia]|uniref:nuclear transcription factor Y subunit B-3-like n=1 Tax=Typha latifolia TaxID=4733 RepID=UPI003C2F5991